MTNIEQCATALVTHFCLVRFACLNNNYPSGIWVSKPSFVRYVRYLRTYLRTTTLIANYIALVKKKCIWLQVCTLLGKHTCMRFKKIYFFKICNAWLLRVKMEGNIGSYYLHKCSRFYTKLSTKYISSSALFILGFLKRLMYSDNQMFQF